MKMNLQIGQFTKFKYPRTHEQNLYIPEHMNKQQIMASTITFISKIYKNRYKNE